MKTLFFLFGLIFFGARAQDTAKNVFACQSFYYYTNLGHLDEYCEFRFSKSIEPNILLATYNKHYCYRNNGTVDCFYSIIYDSTEYEISCENITLIKSDSFSLVTKDSNLIAFRKKIAFELSNEFVLQQKKEERDFLYGLLNSNEPMRILDWSVTSSEYLKWPGLVFEILNTNKKTIKYIWITVTGRNRVGDIVTELGKRNKTVQIIGPINYFTRSSVEFENVWHTDLVSEVDINSIKIQYMDGSIKMITNPKRIILTEKELEYYNSSTKDDVKK